MRRFAVLCVTLFATAACGPKVEQAKPKSKSPLDGAPMLAQDPALEARTAAAAADFERARESAIRKVMDLDRQFSDEVQTGGAKAWASWFAPNGQQIQPGVYVKSREEIEALMAPYLGTPGVKLVWQPDYGNVALGLDMAWTTGRWQSFRNGKQTAEGRYVTIWEKQRDGTWKIAMDLGNPDPAKKTE